MTLSAMIRKRGAGRLATAIPAISATDDQLPVAAVARVATVAVANAKDRAAAPEPPDPIAEVDMEPGWREREAIKAWQQDWTRVAREWRSHLKRHPEWRPLSSFDSRYRIAELVHAWNRRTGQQRDPAEVLDHLTDADYADRELMTPGSLGLVVALFLDSQDSQPWRSCSPPNHRTK